MAYFLPAHPMRRRAMLATMCAPIAPVKGCDRTSAECHGQRAPRRALDPRRFWLHLARVNAETFAWDL